MTDRLNEELKQQIEKTLISKFEGAALDGLKKQVRDLTVEIETMLEYHFVDVLAPSLANFVEEMAKRTIEAVLNGNEREMRRYLGCERGAWTGRSDSPEFGRKRELHEWHSIIHGKLFETGAVALRHALVDAHRELVSNERILDLEDQVRALTAQVNKANSEKEAMFERLRDAQRS